LGKYPPHCAATSRRSRPALPPGFDIGFFATGEITKQMGDTYFPKKMANPANPLIKGTATPIERRFFFSPHPSLLRQ